MLPGCNKNSHLVELTYAPLDLMDGIRFVKSPKCGAINTFSGTIRETDVDLKDGHGVNDRLKPIVAIYYEAYESMVERQIMNIIQSITNNDSSLLMNNADSDENKNTNPSIDENCKIYVALRLGRVPVSESAIVICVSSTGRQFSHKATLNILGRIKSSVLIWKKVIYADGSECWADESKSEAFWLCNETS